MGHARHILVSVVALIVSLTGAPIGIRNDTTTKSCSRERRMLSSKKSLMLQTLLCERWWPRTRILNT
jgi:hypothetical protein